MNNPIVAYARRARHVAWLMARLKAELNRQHRQVRDFDEPSRLWPYVGNLGHLEEELIPLVAFLSGASDEEITNALDEEGQGNE